MFMDSARPTPGSHELTIGTAHLDSDGKWLSADYSLCHLLGFSPGELTARRLGEIFQAAEPEKDSEARGQLLDGAIPHYSSQWNATRSNGTQLPVTILFSVSSNGSPRDKKSILAVVEDQTARRIAEDALHEAETARHELARRLTTAQEEERTRIARELHDDIGQSLAILRIQMLRAGQPVSGIAGKRHPTVSELCDKLRAITDRVSRLSHQLHSSELEYLGLTVAIQSHCREFSEKYKIAVDCTCEDIPPALDGLLALSLLRVVEEALHNAGKHSRAKSIRVLVKEAEDELTLLIEDDGVGFDLEEARLAAGLGLISMRERIHLADGTFKITSIPGQGTRIDAVVPVVLAISDDSAASQAAGL